MTLIEVIVIILVTSFLSFVIGRGIYKKKKYPNKCGGNCSSCCGCNTSSTNLVEKYRKDYPKV